MALFTKKTDTKKADTETKKVPAVQKTIHTKQFVSVLLRPRVTEKSFRIAKQNQYVFDVNKNISKQEAAKQIAKQYGVTVIRSQAVRGEEIKPHYRGKLAGKTQNKKVIVTIAKGQHIDMTGKA
jgi:large subunit ribosomal protein L23